MYVIEVLNICCVSIGLGEYVWLSGLYYIEGSQPEWCISSMISRVPDQNGVSQLYIMLEIHHTGLEPSIYSGDTPFWSETIDIWNYPFQYHCYFQMCVWLGGEGGEVNVCVVVVSVRVGLCLWVLLFLAILITLGLRAGECKHMWSGVGEEGAQIWEGGGGVEWAWLGVCVYVCVRILAHLFVVCDMMVQVFKGDCVC